MSTKLDHRVRHLARRLQANRTAGVQQEPAVECAAFIHRIIELIARHDAEIGRQYAERFAAQLAIASDNDRTPQERAIKRTIGMGAVKPQSTAHDELFRKLYDIKARLQGAMPTAGDSLATWLAAMLPNDGERVEQEER